MQLITPFTTTDTAVCPDLVIAHEIGTIAVLNAGVDYCDCLDSPEPLTASGVIASPGIPAAPESGIAGILFFREEIKVGQLGALLATGATSLVIAYNNIIEDSVNVHIDSGLVSETDTDVAVTGVTYFNDRIVVTFSQGVLANQMVIVTGAKTTIAPTSSNNIPAGLPEVIEYAEGTTFLNIAWTPLRKEKYGVYPTLKHSYWDAENGYYREDKTFDPRPDAKPPDITNFYAPINTPGDGFVVISA